MNHPNPYAFGHQSVETAKLQRALSKPLDFYHGPLDGIYGRDTKAAVEAAQRHFSLVVTGTPDRALLTFLGLASVTPKASTTIFNQIGTILSLIDLLKGKTMTSDQLTGLVRTLLLGIAGYLAGKGYIPAVSPELAAVIATAVVGVFSWISNRPKVISPIGK